MIRAATRAAVSSTARSAIAAASAVMSTATTTATVETTASTTAVEAAATSTTMTATTMLRERTRRAEQRHGSDCAKQNLEESGPVHVCYLHPTATQEVRAARTLGPFYIN